MNPNVTYHIVDDIIYRIVGETVHRITSDTIDTVDLETVHCLDKSSQKLCELLELNRSRADAYIRYLERSAVDTLMEMRLRRCRIDPSDNSDEPLDLTRTGTAAEMKEKELRDGEIPNDKNDCKFIKDTPRTRVSSFHAKHKKYTDFKNRLKRREHQTKRNFRWYNFRHDRCLSSTSNQSKRWSVQRDNYQENRNVRPNNHKSFCRKEEDLLSTSSSLYQTFESFEVREIKPYTQQSEKKRSERKVKLTDSLRQLGYLSRLYRNIESHRHQKICD